ncbi:MAG: radical SAM protein, partial [Vicinamibacteraceae bacterium]
GLDFETKIVVKENAAELLCHELASPRWKPQPIALSGVTDPYQPIERRLQITRRCVEVLADFRNPVAVVTKNFLVTRDADLLAELARHDAAIVFISVTTLDAALQGKLEPRASTPARRLAAIEALARAGVPVGVMVAPVIPAVNDHEIPAILAAAASAGATAAGHVMLRLPYAVKELFERWLEAHLPDRKDKVLARIREQRDGQLNDPRFGSRMRGSGPYASSVHTLFTAACRRAGLNQRRQPLSTAAFRRPEGSQLLLFR